MKTETILAAASIVDPTHTNYFQGTPNEAIDTMVEWAREHMAEYKSNDVYGVMQRRLVNSQPDRVAELCAWALSRLAETA